MKRAGGGVKHDSGFSGPVELLRYLSPGFLPSL